MAQVKELDGGSERIVALVKQKQLVTMGIHSNVWSAGQCLCVRGANNRAKRKTNRDNIHSRAA